MAGAALAGLAGTATAIPTDPAIPFSPTLTRVPGGNCAAIINAETVPQPESGVFGVRVKVTTTGQFCGAYRVEVRWKNLDTGRTNGQSQRIDENGVIDAPGGVITGFGMGPGPGRVEAQIVTTYEDHREMEYIPGRLTWTLG